MRQTEPVSIILPTYNGSEKQLKAYLHRPMKTLS